MKSKYNNTNERGTILYYSCTSTKIVAPGEQGSSSAAAAPGEQGLSSSSSCECNITDNDSNMREIINPECAPCYHNFTYALPNNIKVMWDVHQMWIATHLINPTCLQFNSLFKNILTTLIGR